MPTRPASSRTFPPSRWLRFGSFKNVEQMRVVGILLLHDLCKSLSNSELATDVEWGFDCCHCDHHPVIGKSGLVPLCCNRSTTRTGAPMINSASSCVCRLGSSRSAHAAVKNAQTRP